MSCGLEHLSNCHSEVTILTTLGAGVLLWWRIGWMKVKNFCCYHLGAMNHQRQCHQHKDCQNLPE